MKYVFITIVALTTLVACGVPFVYDDGYNDGNDRYDNGYYRYDSRVRTARSDSYYGTDAYGRTRTSRSYNRYDAYSRHGHSLHSSRYRSFHHGHRRHRYYRSTY